MIVSSRPHARMLFWPAIIAILLPTVLGVLSAWLSRASWTGVAAGWQLPATIAVFLLAAGFFLFFCLAKYLRWLSTRLILTNRRIVVREGMLARKHRDVPLYTLQSLSAHQGVFQRMSRSGQITLISGLGETMILREVPEVTVFKNLVLEAIAELPHSAMLAPERPAGEHFALGAENGYPAQFLGFDGGRSDGQLLKGQRFDGGQEGYADPRR